MPKTATTIDDAPGAQPLLGHLVPILRDPLKFLESLTVCGDLARIRLGAYSAVMACSPEATRRLLLDDRTFDKGGPVFHRLREIFGQGLATCAHSRHRRARRLVQPAFHRQQISGYADYMLREINQVANAWHHGHTIDVLVETTSIAVRSLSATIFSGTTNRLAIREVVVDFGVVVDAVYRRMLTPAPFDRIPSPGKRRYDQARVRLRGSIKRLIAEQRAAGTDTDNVLSVLLAAQCPATATGSGDAPLPDEELCDQVLTLFVGGAETSACLLACALQYLAYDPELQERVHQEARAELTSDASCLPQLVLTTRVLAETLRLSSPGWIFTRSVTEDTHLMGHFIPAGTTVLYSPYVLHRRAEAFCEPNKFDPDRWNDPELPSERGAYLPYGTGARKCIGDIFAYTENTLALATICARWQLEPVAPHPAKTAVGIALRPKELQLAVFRRASQEASGDSAASAE
ncbi:cytochrome P450 [Streptomyces sp. CA-256286]|uniref:cytochrome P450 n=1 Tax=Streptomyces sp. CA-256286 TaxID=2801033 RepID=UPI001A9A0DA5|nr:cytochrome P450 [Streptomyces sp. CA-256286]QTA37041.1 cytochrome P450 [Streptomyces sp. CA-256286]QTA37079.1 cytochrome P450 [Streptomyces sp. CA-256286]